MKINQIIREKRKELSLTQEQIAEFLGVSTPAVNKWEKGSTYPDITLLPALARLLKMDLNTLLSFNEDLTDIEIENFVNELDKVVQEQDYQTAFQMAIDKIHEYPTCERLTTLGGEYRMAFSEKELQSAAIFGIIGLIKFCKSEASVWNCWNSASGSRVRSAPATSSRWIVS